MQKVRQITRAREEESILSSFGIEKIEKETDKQCKVLREVVTKGAAVICSDLKLTEVINLLARSGINVEKIFGGAFAVAFEEKVAIDFLVRQWKFFCDHVPNIDEIDTVTFTTHDECLFSSIDYKEALKIAVENFGQHILGPIGGHFTKAVGIHFAFERDEIVAKKIVAKSF